MSTKKEISSLYIIQAVNFGIPIILIPFLTNKLGINNFGKISYFSAISFFLVFFIDFGFNSSAAKNIAVSSKEKYNILYTNIQILRFLILIVVSIIFYIINFSFNFFEFNFIYVFLYMISMFFLPNWVFLGLSLNSYLAKINLFVKIITTIPIFFIINNVNDYYKVIELHIVSSLLVALLVNIYLIKYKKINYDFKTINLLLMKNQVKEGFDNFIASFFTLSFTYLTPIILKHTVGDSAVGIYSIVEKLISFMRQIYLPINLTFFPKACGYHENKEIKNLINLNIKVTLVYLMIGLIGWFCNFIFGDKVLDIIFDGLGVELKNILNVSIINQIVVSLSMILVNFIIIPSGNAQVLKKIYFLGFLIYFVALILMRNILNLSIVIYMMLFTEIFLTLCFFMFVKHKKILSF